MSPLRTESASVAFIEPSEHASGSNAGAASNSELAVLAEAVLEDHAKLGVTIARLKDLCSTLRGNRASPKPGPAALIAEFKAQLVAHFAAEQAEESFGSHMIDKPRLREQVEHLQGEHTRMLEDLEQLLAFARSGPPGSDLFDRVCKFLDSLDAHGKAENALMQELLVLDEVRRQGPRMRVADIMNCDVSSCSPNDTLETVARVMAERGCNLVVVLDESRHLHGMIGDRDLWMGAYREKAPLSAIVAAAALSQATVLCRPNEEVCAVERRMQYGRSGLAAVVSDRGEFIGIVTSGRIVACRELST